MTAAPSNRKPHLLKAKQGIVATIDAQIKRHQRFVRRFGEHDQINNRTIAIWIKERNILARKCDIPEIPLSQKDGQGRLIYVTE